MYLLGVDEQLMIFVGSPDVSTLTNLTEENLYLCDIPLYDRTREVTLINQQRVAEVDLR